MQMMGGATGRRVVVLAGKGNNGNDGREAARRLRARGSTVSEIDVAEAPGRLPDVDLVIDAAFGTGFRGEWSAPSVHDGTPVLAVDIPSGVDGLTGEPGGDVLRATLTVTFAAVKPGLLLQAGAAAAGEIAVADIGLDVSDAASQLVTASDVGSWYPRRHRSDHKWRHAVRVVAGSPGMGGAASLTCRGAQRAGAGYVRLSTPGGAVGGHHVPAEVVETALPRTGWWSEMAEDLDRFAAVVVGNGLGVDADQADDVRSLVAGASCPVVVDADGLTLLGERAAEVCHDRVVLTPHDGEFARLAGSPPGSDRFASVRSLAARVGAVVLLKGPCTIVAHPDGRTLASVSGDARLATAGTGDVLAGVVGALCARGMDPFRAAAAAAVLHGEAANLGPADGLVAGDLPDLLPTALDAASDGPDRTRKRKRCCETW
jgi:NAD(P)H-hydrate epimerase